MSTTESLTYIIVAKEAAEGGGTIDRGPLVPGGKEKLVKLCSLLRTNVIDLENYYEIARRRASGAYYTESENTDLESGLRSLKDDVNKLLDTLDDIGGYRSEIKRASDVYAEQETRYRALRLLNKGATLRHQIQNGADGRDDLLDFDRCGSRMRKWVSGCGFTSAAQDKNVNLT